MKITFLHLGLAILLFAIPLSHGVAQTPSTVFTYQGNLNHSDAAVSGSYDFEFRLFDAPAGGSQVGSALAVDSVVVDDGLFNLPLDFGDVFSGQNFWLEVQLRPSGAGSYVLLNPRQAITPAPHATYATTAGQAMNGVPAGFSILSDSKTPSPGYSWNGERIHPTPAQWLYKAQSPDGFTNTMGAAVSGKFYIMSLNQSIAAYDPLTDTWDQTLTPRPAGALGFASMAAIGEKIYIVLWSGSGGDASSQLFVYTPALDSWNSLILPFSDSSGTVAALNGKLYIFRSDATHVYNPVTNSWTEAEDAPAGHYVVQAVAVGDKLFTFSYNQTAYVYDPAADDGPGGNTAWTATAPAPSGRNHFIAVGLENKIYALGGVLNNTVLTTNDIYDTESNTWTTGAPMQTGRYAFAAAAVEGCIYVTGPSIITSMEQFTPERKGYFIHIKN